VSKVFIKKPRLAALEEVVKKAQELMACKDRRWKRDFMAGAELRPEEEVAFELGTALLKLERTSK
jgi:hypothetical protein